MDGDPTPALTGRRRTRPTSTGCRNPWQPKPGRAPLIAAQAAVQTNRATSPAPGAPARRAEGGGGGPRLEQSRLPRARLDLGCASGDPVQEERSPGGLSGVGLRQSQPRGAALGAAERVARDCDPLEKTASSFMGVLCLAAALDWLKP